MKKKLIRLLHLHDLFCSPTQWTYRQMLKERDKAFPRSFEQVHCDGIPGLVSIILPVHNGARYLSEAIESVRAQDYPHWELIIVDDGSTDGSAAIALDYTRQDHRIRYIYQENQKLPGALNTGHAEAKGEFITWTSDDNRLKTNFLSVLVQEMKDRPSVDMLYANLEVIDDAGRITGTHNYYRDYQYPEGSGQIQLPHHVSMLHAWNFIGAAFLYRRRAIILLGGYSAYWCICEDYDFFLRVNAQMTVRHTRFLEALYQYRVHLASLTSRSGDSFIAKKLEALQIFDDGRRDLLSGPAAWFIQADPSAACCHIRDQLKQLVAAQGHFLPEGDISAIRWGTPVIFVSVTENGASAPPPEAFLCHARIRLAAGPTPPSPADSGDWTLRLSTEAPEVAPGNPFHSGVLSASEPEVLFHLMHAHGAARFLQTYETFAAAPEENPPDISVLVCTNRRIEFCERALRSLIRQSLAPSRYEIIVVNNAPGKHDYQAAINSFSPPPGLKVQEIPALPGGLSYARNVGAAAAQGEILLYMDDDAEADYCLLEETVNAYKSHPAAGGGGGSILLSPPDPAPWWWGPELAPFWSEFRPDEKERRTVTDWLQFPYGANLSIRRKVLWAIGGFRSRYGPGGRKTSWGDDTVVCLQIRQAGHDILLTPKARVFHHVDPARFSLSELFRMCRQSYSTMSLMIQEKRIPANMNFITAGLRAAVRFALALVPVPHPLSWRIRQLALAQGLIACSVALLRYTLYPLFTRPPESANPPSERIR